MNLAVWLQRQAQVQGSQPALFLGWELVADYSEFGARVAALAGWLRAQGINTGDRVAIFMKNCPDYLITQYAIWYIGAAAVPINAKLHGREAEFILQDSGARMVFTSPELTEALTSAQSAIAPIDISGAAYAQALSHAPVSEPVSRAADDMAWLFYTSGTTGRPKGVMITHGMLMSMSLA